ncbi:MULTISPECIES: type VI secretion system tube protein Hcp [Agrobacterium]|jgi:type VI secretion system secreted protein Hcp|uniref:type VI secretion system tube protein Hcp n=1 Tax=Agrobacterium TaxID=357 RepID=UPI0011EDAFD6|nr:MULTISPECIES: type VI secretion system tube protein Hcp [Agrobacterium]TZG32235.1 type VI secretion system tube protein Hcp [Agrobacterium sp. B1(2019)]
MSIDAFLYFPGQSDVVGETLDSDMAEKRAFELKNFDFTIKNKISIGSYTGGGGAGKADFDPVTVEKRTDTGSCGLFSALCSGKHFDEAILELRRSGGSNSSSGTTFMKVHFKMVMIADMNWTAGEDSADEKIQFEYGAIKIEYFRQAKDGRMTKASGGQGETKWSRVMNRAIYEVK